MSYTKKQFDEMQNLLYTAVIADILDELGYKNFTLDSKIHPILDSGNIIGYTRTAYAVDVFEIPAKPYKNELAYIDSIKEGDVIVSTVNGTNYCGFFGELLATAATVRGGRGAIIDGYSRDVSKINDIGFPLYCTGMNPLDSKGRADIIFYDQPIICGGVEVNTGDLVFGDIDGIVIVPKAAVEKVIDKAMAKVNGENTVRDELRKGRSATEVFEEYGIL